MSWRTRQRRRSNEVAHSTSSFAVRPTPIVLNLRSIEDRRSYHPDGPLRPAKTVSGHRIKPLVVKTPTNKKYGWKAIKAASTVPKKVSFSVPKKTLICIRREQRREVLHALKKTKRGAGGSRKLNWFSEVSCKR